MSSSIILSQTEYETLLKEIAFLKDRIAALTALRDDLVYHICPALRSEYEEKIAGLERELFAAQLYLREKQRIIELLQSQINRRQKPSMDEARRKAREEYKEYQEDLKKKAREAEDFQKRWKEDTDWYRHDQTDRRQRRSRKSAGTEQAGNDKDTKKDTASGQASDQKDEKKEGQDRKEEKGKDSYRRIGQDHGSSHKDSATFGDTDQDHDNEEDNESAVQEIKRLYRKIVKLLHPDVHPNPTEREKELLNRANNANARGDLEEMRAIWKELSAINVKEEEFADTPEDLEKMREILETLRERCQALEKEIRHIQSEYPYTMKAFLDDEESVEEKRAGLRAQIDQTRERDRQLADYIEELKKKLNN